MSEQEIQLVNELLLGATPPTREFLERAKACVKIEVFDAWQDAA